MHKTTHKDVVNFPNIITNKNLIIKKIVKSTKTKSNIGSKLNKLNKDLRIDFKDKLKILKKARSNGYFTLFSYVKVYRKHIKISYEFIQQKIKNDDEFACALINEGILIKRVNKEKVENNSKTYYKYYISADTQKRKEFLKICTMLTKQYQKEVFLDGFSKFL